MANILDKVLRAGEGRILGKLRNYAKAVNALEDSFSSLTDEELRSETDSLRERYAAGESLDDMLPEAFAAVREAAKRTLGMRPYDVQIMGGAALHLGNIAEMKTGEGKTLVATTAAYLNAIAGRGVHIVTVNDFLANYQSELMGRVFRALGMTTGCILAGQDPAQRRAEYLCDITYGTNNEFGFDYLRDNMAWDYEIDEKKRTVGILEPGISKVEDYLGIDNLYESANTPLISFLNNSLKAIALFKRDKDYVVMNGEVLIVDEHTGRMLPGRRYNEGVHQAIEAKEGVEIKAENQTLATITLQNYFRLYKKIAGMTGTAETEAGEFMSTYKLGVVPIPTNRPMIRLDQSDLIFKNEEIKFAMVVEDIAERHAKGQPVLVGTTSVEKSEYLSKLLAKRGVRHEVLNAKNHAREAAIVAQAGRLGAVTVATNMAGRGTDVMLGGNAEFLTVDALNKRGLNADETPEEYEKAWAAEFEKIKAQVAVDAEQVLAAGGLYVLGTERHESRRIDNQLRGRSGRQGDVGESRFYLSLTDDLMRLFNSGAAASMMNRPGVPDDTAIESKLVSRAIQSAQSQVEGRNAEIRKNVLKYDDVMSRQREAIYADRRHILEGDDIQNRISGFLEDVIKDVVNQHIVEGTGKDWDLDALWSDLKTIYPIGLEISEVLAEAGNRNRLTRDWLTRELISDAKVAYAKRSDEIGDAAMRELERRVVLSVVDRKWRDHLYEMDYLKEGIGLRAMAQRDPLVEYQREGYGMFQQMMGAVREESVSFMFNIEVQVQASAPVVEVKPDVKKLTYTSPSEDGTAEIHQGGSNGPVKPSNDSKKSDGKSAPGSSFFKN